MGTAATDDWDAVGRQDDGLPEAWRRRARVEHLDLLARWCGPLEGRWLKTDLYEERTVERSLVPALPDADWVGMDVSVEVVRRAAPAVGAAAVTDVRALAFADDTFDGVLSTSTLDHFADLSDVAVSLRELRRVLRPGGLLVLTLDNPANPFIRTRNALPRPIARATGLVPFAVGVTVDERGGRDLLTATGFEVRGVEHLLHAPHVVGTRLAAWGWWAEHVLPRFSRLARTRAAPRTGHYVAFLATAGSGPPQTS